jgi:hypothetical protein
MFFSPGIARRYLMRIYDRRGMLNIPTPQKRLVKSDKSMLLVKECYCQNGHNLIDHRVTFNGYSGICLKTSNGEKEGTVGLSPVYGEKCRIAMDIEFKEGEIYQFYCPHCNIDLPVFSPCHCGADIITLFLNPEADFANCIGICNRVGCANSVVRSRGELLSLAVVNTSQKRSGLIQSFMHFR